MSSHSLWPREHGAYAELLFPLATALAMGGPTASGLGFAAAATMAFLLHEPLAVLAGTRGSRVRAELGARAGRRLAVLAPGVLAGAAAGFAMGSRASALAALVPASVALALLPAAAGRRLKTLAGELLVAVALASAGLPVALAGGVAWPQALAAAAVWVASFALATVSVHGLKAAAKTAAGNRWTARAAPLLSGLVLALAAALAWIGVQPAQALVPPAAVALALGVLQIHPRRLRRVGWSIVGANTAAAVLLVAPLG